MSKRNLVLGIGVAVAVVVVTVCVPRMLTLHQERVTSAFTEEKKGTIERKKVNAVL